MYNNLREMKQENVVWKSKLWVDLRGDVPASFIGKFLGFTLAEVLITLGIIGVVVAMTLPALIGKYQEKQWKVAYKRHIRGFSQAFLQLQENGELLLFWCQKVILKVKFLSIWKKQFFLRTAFYISIEFKSTLHIRWLVFCHVCVVQI